MKKKVGIIYEETDYSCFHRLVDNRDLLDRRLGRLIASISEKYIINPIIVNEKMEIIDGQGRFEALKSLRRPIHYIIAEGATSDDCRRMNKYNTKWTTLDFAKSYKKSNIKAYELLLECCEKTGQSITRVLRLGNHSGERYASHESTKMTAFESGRLTFDESDSAKVEQVVKFANEILDALQFTKRPNDAFYTAVKICCDTNGYNHRHMISNCKKKRSSYTQMSNLGDQLKELERIYNFRAGKGMLYFSDYMRNRGANVRDYSSTYTPYTDTDVSTLVAKER